MIPALHWEEEEEESAKHGLRKILALCKMLNGYR